MTTSEIHRLGQAWRDPAVTVLALLPLALLHLSGRSVAALEAFSMVELALEEYGSIGVGLLWGFLMLGILWVLGRIRELELAWAGAVALLMVEGILWSLLLGPGLSALTQWLPLEVSPLVWGQLPESTMLIANQLAIAAGAGLYEELLFRGVALGGVALLLNYLFQHVAGEITARRLSFFLALLLSSAAFAMAHGLYGHVEAFETEILAFRMLAGLAFGLLFAFRGLAVAAYAHFAYDAIYLLA